MTWVRVVVRPLGPARVAARPLSSPGVVARDRAWPAPPPSTLLGALGSLKGVVMQCPDAQTSTERAEKQLKALAEALGVRRIWGPLIVAEGRTYVQIGDDVLAELRPGGGLGERRGVKTVRRIGLALGEGKTAIPGLLYAATYLAESAEFVYYVDAEVSLKGGLAKLGGEGRLALVEIKEEKPPVEAAEGTALVISPLLMPEGRPPDGVEPLGLLDYDRRGGWGLSHKVPVVQWGLGFSEVCRERRPLYPALAPGVVVALKRPSIGEGYLSELGYGSVLPLKI